MDELLQLLKKNALETPEDLAKMLNLSAAEVRAKIADYEQRGIIRGYQAVVNEDGVIRPRCCKVEQGLAGSHPAQHAPDLRASFHLQAVWAIILQP